MIARDPQEAQDAQHDLIVIGGGIYGCTLALEAARRGLRPLLLERDDFGQHTSGSWLRILHGGLRYLQSLDLRRHVASVRERRWFLRHLPDLVQPLPCLMPLYGRGLHRRPVLATALAVNDLLSLRRNAGVRPDRRLARGRIVSAAEVRRTAPSVEPEGLVGGAVWYDAIAPRPQRLLMEILRWAVREGARAANYVEVEGLLEHDGAVAGVIARDVLTKRPLNFRSSVVVNCAGPWAAGLAGRLDVPVAGLFRPSLAFNVLFDRAPDFDHALAVTAERRGARTYFLLPAMGGVLAGTYHAPATEGGAFTPPSRELVATFARELDEAVPKLNLGSAPARHVFWGQLPVRREGTVDLVGRDVIHDHGTAGGPKGLFTVSGVKFTVARAVAVRTLSVIARRGYWSLNLPTETAAPSPRRVPEVHGLLSMAKKDRTATCELIRAIVDEESVVQPDDLLRRRTDWALAAPDLRPVSALVQEAMNLGSNESRK